MATATLTETLEKLASGYRWGDHVIQRCQSDELLAYAYSRFKRDNLLDVLYYENPITMLQFVMKYLEPDTNALACFRMNNQGDLSLTGLGWLNEYTKMGPDHARASCGMGFFRRVKGEAPLDLVRFGQMMAEWAFDHLCIDNLCGATPAKNPAAVRFSKKVGFHVIGPFLGGTVWQGELCDVYLSSMPKDRWEKIRPWKEMCDGRSLTEYDIEQY